MKQRYNLTWRHSFDVSSAQDNVKYLERLQETNCVQLYRGDPLSVRDGVVGLMQAIKMIREYVREFATS